MTEWRTASLLYLYLIFGDGSDAEIQAVARLMRTARKI